MSTAVSVTVDAPPTVNITTSPANGSLVPPPANITITANAADSDGTITRVDFYQPNRGNALIGTVTTPPYSITLTNVSTGLYLFTAKATDNYGVATTSSQAGVLVDTPPTVSITSPVNNAVFSAPANITITANAANSNSTISVVSFYQGSTLIGTHTTAPYSISWTNVPSGTYTLTARAADSYGAGTTSTAVTIQVQ
jgi:chitinase